MAAKSQRYLTRKSKDGRVVLRVDKKKKEGEYFFVPGAKQAEFISKIELKGFDYIPSGFYTSGNGLTHAGYHLAAAIYKKWEQRFNIIILESGSTKLFRRGRGIFLNINHDELRQLNLFFRNTRTRGTELIQSNILSYLNEKSPEHFKAEEQKTDDEYKPGEISKLLKKNGVLPNLDEHDRQSLHRFIPKYVDSIPLSLRSNKQVKIITDLVDAGKQVYLKEIIEEFEKRLHAKTQNENSWQRFLSAHILIFRNTYGEILEKISIALGGKFPDFMLIDPYNYLDIYEIKRPDTKLLEFEKGRQNYYWSKALAQAISQVENYIHQVQRNSDTLINDVKREKDIEVNIVRPRGYIIAGKRIQLENSKMEDHFRILNEALKNIDVIFYDDLLVGLKTFLNRINQN